MTHEECNKQLQPIIEQLNINKELLAALTISVARSLASVEIVHLRRLATTPNLVLTREWLQQEIRAQMLYRLQDNPQLHPHAFEILESLDDHISLLENMYCYW